MVLSFAQKIKSLAIVTIGGVAVCGGILYHRGNEKFFTNYFIPAVHLLEPEFAHHLGIYSCKYRFFPKSRFRDPESLRVDLFGRTFSNPIGMSAGFDKNAETGSALNDMGFGFAEFGSVTPNPQLGNDKPRLFRLPEDKACINRLGMNNKGYNEVFQNLFALRQKNFNGIIGVNVANNKDSANEVEDYAQGIKNFLSVADYLVLNISCPNVPEIKESLENIISASIKVMNECEPSQRKPIFLKLSPDLTKTQREMVANLIKDPEYKVDGLIISNTTTKRIGLKNKKYIRETGGLSGKPLMDESTKMIAEMYKLTNGMTIIGVGGISSGADAYEKIKAGAKLLQLYTLFVYEGPPCVNRVKKELAELLEKDGYCNISEAVGANVKMSKKAT